MTCYSTVVTCWRQCLDWGQCQTIQDSATYILNNKQFMRYIRVSSALVVPFGIPGSRFYWVWHFLLPGSTTIYTYWSWEDNVCMLLHVFVWDPKWFKTYFAAFYMTTLAIFQRLNTRPGQHFLYCTHSMFPLQANITTQSSYTFN